MKLWNTTLWHQQRGSMTLMLAVFILPLIFFAFSISMDLSVYFTEAQRAQKIVDDAALHSFRFLPYREATKTAACSQVSQFLVGHKPVSCGDTAEVTVAADGSLVTVAIRTKTTISLATYFGIDAGFPIEVFASGRGTPFDTLIALDTSAYLAPDVISGPAWGSPSEWPAATFFQLNPLYQNGQALDARLLTQQCINPIYASLKRAAITTYEYVIANGLNAAGMAYYPGSSSFVETARDVLPYTSGQGQISYTPYERPFSSTAFCLAVAETEVGGGPLSTPSPSLQLLQIEDQDSTRPSPIVMPGSWLVNPDYNSYFRVRELTWAQPARDTIGDFVALLNETRSRLVGSSFAGSRGGMASHQSRNAVIFAGDLPWSAASGVLQRYSADNSIGSMIVSEFNTIAQDLENYDMQMTLHYVLLEHSNVTSGSFYTDREALRELLENWNLGSSPQQSRLNVRFIYGSDSAQLADQVVGALVLERRQAVLAQ